MNKLPIHAGTDDEDHAEVAEKTGFWGSEAAGCLLLCSSTKRFLFGLRSSLVDEPLTWAGWGGAIDLSESPEQAVIRELREETGYNGRLSIEPLCKFRKPGFTYHNFLIVVDIEFTPTISPESSEYGWFEFEKLPSPMHPGVTYCLQNRESFSTILRKLRNMKSPFLERLDSQASQTTMSKPLTIFTESMSMNSFISRASSDLAAAIKPAENYDWFEYQGPPLTLSSGKGLTTTLQRGSIFGVRPSANGKQIRFVDEKLGMTKVFTLDYDVAVLMGKKSKPVKAPLTITDTDAAQKVWMQCLTELDQIKRVLTTKPLYLGSLIKARNFLDRSGVDKIENTEDLDSPLEIAKTVLSVIFKVSTVISTPAGQRVLPLADKRLLGVALLIEREAFRYPFGDFREDILMNSERRVTIGSLNFLDLFELLIVASYLKLGNISKAKKLFRSLRKGSKEAFPSSAADFLDTD